MPEIEQFSPARAQLLKKKMTDLRRAAPPEELAWEQYYDIVRRGSPEEILKEAAKAPKEPSEMLYQQAIVMAAAGGKGDAIRELINDQVADESRRKSLIESLDSEMVGFAIHSGKTEEVEKLLPRIQLKQERARALAQLSIIKELKGQHTEAVSLLNEAQGLVKMDLKSYSQTNAMLTLLLAYALVDPGRAFQLVEGTIDRANEMLSTLVLLDKVMKQSGLIKKGEFLLQGPGLLPLDDAFFLYGKGVTALARVDFSRTVAAADRFQRNELRLMARLLVARSVLQDSSSPDSISPPR
jgi:hypothetical protein